MNTRNGGSNGAGRNSVPCLDLYWVGADFRPLSS